MTSENLVVLKDNKVLEFKTDILKPNINYRCIAIDNKNFLVYGIVFSKAKFNKLFEYTHTRMLNHFKTLGLIDANGVPVSKSLFTKLADIHTYGNGRKAFKVWYFRTTREVIYGFYPMQGTAKENQTECYQWFLEVVNGNMEAVDSHDIMFGNCGIPLAYGALRIS
jgi:hypothetical protein